MKTNYDLVNQGQYPQPPMWKSKWEKFAFSGMLLFSIAIYFQIAFYYVYSGAQ